MYSERKITVSAGAGCLSPPRRARVSAAACYFWVCTGFAHRRNGIFSLQRFFTEDRLAAFNFLLITLQDFPEEELCEACFPIDVIPSPPVDN